MAKFTVIGFMEDTGQSFADFIDADNGFNAFRKSAEQRPMATFVVALDGHIAEGRGATYPGEGVVSAETIMAQPDVFR